MVEPRGEGSDKCLVGGLCVYHTLTVGVGSVWEESYLSQRGDLQFTSAFLWGVDVHFSSHTSQEMFIECLLCLPCPGTMASVPKQFSLVWGVRGDMLTNKCHVLL